MQAPSGTVLLDLIPKDEQPLQIQPGSSLQKILRFDLREEGSHTLAVNVSYSETTAFSGRARTFRKLYQFVSRPCLNVRTKVTPFLSSSSTREDEEDPQRMALEAQLDNLADGPVVLRTVKFLPKPAFTATSLNWDASTSFFPPSISDFEDKGKVGECPIMAPRDVRQIAFLVERVENGPGKDILRDGRTVLGQLSVEWGSNMGESGALSTGWLTTKRR